MHHLNAKNSYLSPLSLFLIERDFSVLIEPDLRMQSDLVK